MSDSMFDQDLRAVLRAMAPGEVPASLRAAVAAVPRTHPVPAPHSTALRRSRLAVFAPIAAVVVLGLAGLVILFGGRYGGNVAAPSPAASPALSPITHWTTLVYEIASPSASASPGSSAVAVTHVGIAQARLEAARVPFTSQATANGFRVTVPTAQTQLVEAILGTTGAMAFVPMGNEAVGDGATIDLAAHPALFGSEGVASASAGTDQTGQRTLDLTLNATVKALFATYTSAHIGEYFAIVLDGKVLTAPVIKSDIPNGQVQITGSGAGGMDPALQTTLIAILTTGPYPQPVTQVSSEPASPPADPWTPGPIVAPTPSPTVKADVPAGAVASELPAVTGKPASVAAPFVAATVSSLPGSTVDAARVTAWAHGYLGFGSSGASPTGAWTSPDGRSWTAWPDGMLGLGSGGAKLIGFAACRQSALAFFTANGSIFAAASPDGRTWTTTLVDTPSDLRFGNAPLAGGERGAVLAVQGERAVTVTTDCRTWQKVQLDVPTDVTITGMAATSGGWVAVGNQGTSVDNVKATAFWSVDGTTWNAADVSGSDRMGFLGAPAVGSQGMVALAGKAGTMIATETYYQSVDGKSWKPTDGILGLKTDTDGSSVPAATYIGDGRQMLVYGQRNGNTDRGFEYYTSLDGNLGNGVSFDGPASSSVIGFDTAGQFTPTLLRDGILFVDSNGPSLFGQAVSP